MNTAAFFFHRLLIQCDTKAWIWAHPSVSQSLKSGRPALTLWTLIKLSAGVARSQMFYFTKSAHFSTQPGTYLHRQSERRRFSGWRCRLDLHRVTKNVKTESVVLNHTLAYLHLRRRQYPKNTAVKRHLTLMDWGSREGESTTYRSSLKTEINE